MDRLPSICFPLRKHNLETAGETTAKSPQAWTGLLENLGLPTLPFFLAIYPGMGKSQIIQQKVSQSPFHFTLLPLVDSNNMSP